MNKTMTYRKVRQIEKAPLPLREQVELLLVYANQKPATELLLWQRDNPLQSPDSTTYRIDPAYPAKIARLAERLKLPHHVGEQRTYPIGAFLHRDGTVKHTTYKEIVPLFVGKDEGWLERILRASDEVGPYNARTEGDREYGRCCGYPETAIEAYLGERSPSLRSFVDERPEGYFTQFVFSQDYAEEEFASTSRRWHDTVRRLSQKLYNQVRTRYKQIGAQKNNIIWR